MVKEEKTGWKKRIVDELRKLSITVIYIWVLLSVFALFREIILANYHINYSVKFGFALINALILAKFMWLGEILHAGKKAAGTTLLYSTLWNSALFAVILMVCHLLEETLLKLWHGQSIVESFSETLAEPRGIFALALVMFVVLIPFFFAKGLIEILGEEEIKRLLLKSRPKDSPLPAKN
jgi:hypothetical protein